MFNATFLLFCRTDFYIYWSNFFTTNKCCNHCSDWRAASVTAEQNKIQTSFSLWLNKFSDKCTGSMDSLWTESQRLILMYSSTTLCLCVQHALLKAVAYLPLNINYFLVGRCFILNWCIFFSSPHCQFDFLLRCCVLCWVTNVLHDIKHVCKVYCNFV